MMRSEQSVQTAGRIVLGLVVVGWIAGGASQVVTRQLTGYMDIFPPQLALGALICVGAGAAWRLLEPAHRGWRNGVIAGLIAAATVIAGYWALTAILWNPAWGADQGGETWFSMLIEAPFWIGIPGAISAGLGLLGWWLADRWATASSRAQAGMGRQGS